MFDVWNTNEKCDQSLMSNTLQKKYKFWSTEDIPENKTSYIAWFEFPHTDRHMHN